MLTLTADQVTDIRARDEKLRAWMGKRNSYKPEELPADIVPPTNDERSAAEVFEFMRDKPDRYFLYVDEKAQTVTTWTGDKLGDCQLGRAYRDNFGGKRQSIVVQAINGCRYHGTYFASAGNYARVKRAKQRA